MGIVVPGPPSRPTRTPYARPRHPSGASSRIVVVSNRLPVRVQDDARELRLVPADGGLVTALGPLVRRRGGLWIGWPGLATEDREAGPREYRLALERFARDAGFGIHPVHLCADEIEAYYTGFCNGVLWPLLHGFAPSDSLSEGQWEGYRQVNEHFAEAVLREVRRGDEVLINDYHLLLVPGLLREQGLGNSITCFIHTPFPPGELFERLPWAEDIAASLLQADRVGFQTALDHRNFVSTVERRPTRERHSGVYPISVDVDEFQALARSEQTRTRASAIRAEMDVPHLLLGVDRLDCTKGLLEKLAGLESLLAERPQLQGSVCLTQLVIPSRESVSEYRALRDKLERRVGEINGRFSARGWVPVHYQYGRWSREELVAQYAAADVAVVTPVRDGMNLVAKEFCVCQPDEAPGALILSRFAGAASELREALVVNPHGARAVADALHTAITMPIEERRRRMSSMVRRIRTWDVYEWAQHLLQVGEGAKAGRPALRPVG